eukprot:TRINITY_DN102798_c0_g1_i1.p1 TRINITY_DN102798_c0_g1~~TRINITY_DN102798_c0_g1_i1.p1  ORF type:complete len:968 (-),score=291.69 TRINITY_DN102798_c0_g1_i1:210-3113(-)
MSKEAAKIMAKYPSHYPVICVSDDGAMTRKLLVPANMASKEFESVVRDRCAWACTDSLLQLNGETILQPGSVSDIYSKHNAADGFLYVTVSSSSTAERTPSGCGSSRGFVETEPEKDASESMSQSVPPTFHMPDHDLSPELQQASVDADRARKLLKKYPDRMPVLVNQAASAGLPRINKKFIVPRSMTVSGLQHILPGHLAFPADLQLEWSMLQVYMGGERISKDATMNDVYNQYVDDGDSGLHITLRLEGLKNPQEERDAHAPATHARQSNAILDRMQEVADSSRPIAEDEIGGVKPKQETEHVAENLGPRFSPPVIHMPDHDQIQELQSVSVETQRARKVLKKHPDRVPVLVNQAASTSLPRINRKLLVPQSMTVSGLQSILPKHLSLAEDAHVKWSMLRIFMGEEPIPDDAVMQDVYKQYVDEDDGGLHITLRIDEFDELNREGEVEAPVTCGPQLKGAFEESHNAADSANQNGTSEEMQHDVLGCRASSLAGQLEDTQLQLQRAEEARISESEKTVQAQAILRETEVRLAAEVEKAEQFYGLQRKLQEELLVLQAELEAKNQQDVLESENASQLCAALQAAESKLAEKQEKAEQYTNSQEKMQTQILKLQQELEAKTQENIAHSDNVSQLCAALDAAEAKLASESEKAEQHREIQQRLQDELLLLQTELEALQQDKMCEAENTSRLCAILHEAEAKLAAEAEQHNEFQESMRTKVLALQKELETKDQEIAKKSEKISQLCAELETKDQEIDKKSEKVSQLCAELDGRMAIEAETAERHEGQLQKMQAQLSALQIAIEAKRQDMEALQMRVLEAERRNEQKMTDLEESLNNAKEMLRLEAEKCNSVQEALKCSEEKVLVEESRNQKKSEEMEQRLESVAEQLAAENAEKQCFQERAALLQNRLACLEEAEMKRQEAERTRAARRQELAAEGFVHLGWDRDGVCAELDDDDQEFEVLVDDGPIGK